MTEPDRREFLDTLLFTSIAASAAAALAPVPFFLVPPRDLLRPRRVSAGPRSAIASNAAKEVIYGGRKAIVLNRGGSILAFDATCTHTKCPVNWVPDRQEFHCPCHKGVFDAEGNPRSGPVSRPLARLKAEETPSGEILLGD